MTSARRFPLRLTLGSIVVGLLLLTVAGILVAWVAVRDRTREATTDALTTEAARALSTEVLERLDAAETTLRQLAQDATAGRLPAEDLATVSERLVERMRCEARFEWVAYVAATSAGAYVQRRPDGVLVRARGTLGSPLAVETIAPDGDRAEGPPQTLGLASVEDVPWYRIGAEGEGPTWTPLFRRAVDGGVGRACALAVRRDGKVVGVLGVGFSTEFGSAALARLWGERPGVAAGYDFKTGRIGAASSARATGDLKPLLESATAELPRGADDLPPGAVRTWVRSLGGETWLVSMRRLEGRAGASTAMAILVPEDALVGYFTRWRGAALLGVGLLLAGAIGAALLVAHRIARPLRAIAADLEKVGSFQISDAGPLVSRIAEVAVVSEATARMKRSLRSFGRYVPTDLVRELLSRGHEASLGGSTRALTLFFSDVQGFTSISEGMAPQALVEALGAYLEVLVGAVSAAGGTVDKFVGDGVVAFFGAPRDDPRHPASACLAALAVQAALAGRRPTWEAAGRPAFLTRIGLHTDEVVVGNIGTPERFAYTVIGDGVNLAARLEALNKAYGTWILASDATRAAAGAGFEWRPIDRVAVVGRASGTDVFELLGEAGRVPAGVLAARDRYAAGLAAHFARRFEEAASLFGEAAALRPDDKAAPALRARALAFSKEPPPADWAGVDVKTRK